MSVNYRHTGYKSPQLRAYQAAGSSNNLISAPGSGKTIVIYDIIVIGSSSDQLLRAGSSGSVLMLLGDGHGGLAAPIAVGDDKPLFISKSADANTTYAVMVTYSIKDA